MNEHTGVLIIAKKLFQSLLRQCFCLFPLIGHFLRPWRDCLRRAFTFERLDVGKHCSFRFGGFGRVGSTIKCPLFIKAAAAAIITNGFRILSSFFGGFEKQLVSEPNPFGFGGVADRLHVCK